MTPTEAVQSRRSVRAFTDQPVDREVLTRVLEKAQRSPSGGNVQPWNAVMLTGEPMQALFDRVTQEFPKGREALKPEYDIYPK
ncbi:MAG: nitroreductase, partial [Erythrobacter sp.]|nr:nitroreductase [Erythrobacter sp.]